MGSFERNSADGSIIIFKNFEGKLIDKKGRLVDR